MTPTSSTRVERLQRGVNTAGTYAITLLGGGIAALLSLMVLTMIFFGGCEDQVIGLYGQTLPRYIGTSVNGPDVLMDMFTQAGHQVATRRVLVSSRLESVSAIVWIPNARSAPSEEVCEWFDTWLAERPGRTLVYVGRDYDAAPIYWRSMMPYVSKEQQLLYRQRLLDAAAAATRGKAVSKVECSWFTIEAGKTRKIRELAGTWSRDIDPERAALELRDRLVPTRRADLLLTSPPDILVSRQSDPAWNESRVIVVANGSFLLNMPLVTHDNRILAKRLVAAVGPPGRVVFLESGEGGPIIEPDEETPGLWRMLGAWPINVILLQLAALGIIFCFARWPILGRPRAPAAEVTSDFRKHVDAVGALLRATRDRAYAHHQIDELARVARRAGPSERTDT